MSSVVSKSINFSELCWKYYKGRDGVTRDDVVNAANTLGMNLNAYYVIIVNLYFWLLLTFIIFQLDHVALYWVILKKDGPLALLILRRGADPDVVDEVRETLKYH